MTTFTRRTMLDTLFSAAAASMVTARPTSAGSQVGATARPRIIGCDVNETLLEVVAARRLREPAKAASFFRRTMFATRAYSVL